MKLSKHFSARISASALTVSALTFSALVLPACGPRSAQSPQDVAQLQASESERLNTWFEARYQDELARSPLSQTYLGLKTNADKIDDYSRIAEDELALLRGEWLEEMRSEFDVDKLKPKDQVSYRLYEFNALDTAVSHRYIDQSYIFQHMSGPHTQLPSFLINFHKIETQEDAQNFITRLTGSARALNQSIDRAEDQASKDILLPKFVYDKIITSADNVIAGAPFDDSGKDSILLKHVKEKLGTLSLSNSEQSQLIADAETALRDNIGPAYRRLTDVMRAHKGRADDRDGAWKLPDGDQYYQARLKHYTTTDLTADEIHDIGLAEVERIQTEMRKIMEQVDFKGDLKAFYDFLRTDKQFMFPNTDEGRAAYMQEATAIIDDMEGRLDNLFITKPVARMIVKRVEPFREASAFGAFYNSPAKDGSRPGIYYINLKDVRDQPKYLMQALAYHEGIPGHHMQLAIAQELEDLPEFRKQTNHTAYVEGWALYAESVPAELGLYTDPYSDFGRLSMEIFRAARLVVDTGLHHKKWTREEAVQYMLANIANPEADIRAEVDRYIVWPGQATAYKIGMLKIVELRRDAEVRLGGKFDIREFHDVILANGSVPLSVLETFVEDWITAKLKS